MRCVFILLMKNLKNINFLLLYFFGCYFHDRYKQIV